MVWKKLFQVSFLISEEEEEQKVHVIHITPKKAFHLSFCKLWKYSGKLDLNNIRTSTLTDNDTAGWNEFPASCCNSPRKDVSFSLPFKDVCSSYTQTNLFTTLQSFHSYIYTWECPFSTPLWEFYWCTKNIRYKKVLYREPNFIDTWQKWVYIATKHQASYPECWFHIPGKTLFLLLLKFPKLLNQLLKLPFKVSLSRQYPIAFSVILTLHSMTKQFGGSL